MPPRAGKCRLALDPVGTPDDSDGVTARASRLRPARRRRARREVAPAWAETARILGAFLLVALALRTFVVMPRSIPSESMMPALVPGDYVAVAKWPYGWSRFSPPLALPWPHGRLAGALPARGDVVVFRAPGGGGDYIKRVIGLPGDTVAMRAGRLVLDGRVVPRAATADFVLPLGRDEGCRGIALPPYGRIVAHGHATCRLPRFVETLPGGRRYAVIDQGWSMGDDMATVTVPAGRLFVLGDNRDLSEDSRFPVAAGGVGLVPAENVEGRAGHILFSTAAGLAGLRPSRVGRAAG